MKGHAEMCVRRYCELTKKDVSYLQRVTTSTDDHLTRTVATFKEIYEKRLQRLIIDSINQTKITNWEILLKIAIMLNFKMRHSQMTSEIPTSTSGGVH